MITALILLVACAPVIWWIAPKTNSCRMNKVWLVTQCGALALASGTGLWWLAVTGLVLSAMWWRAVRISGRQERELALFRQLIDRSFR